MMLVIWFFMHVRTDNPLTKLFVFAGFFWMAILLVLTLGDYFLARLDASRQVLVIRLNSNGPAISDRLVESHWAADKRR